jgi:hypothetical protein
MPTESAALRFRLVSVAVLSLFAAPAFADLAATAVVSTSSSAAPFDYTISVKNTGTADIGTFWFAWTPTPASYDFLPSSPTGVSGPTNWAAPVIHSGFPGDGYSIEYYNNGGSPIAAGGTGLFHFTSNDSPNTLLGNAFFPGNKITTSFIYSGFPEVGAATRLDASVAPEPASATLACIAAIMGSLLLWRKKSAASA